MATKMSQVQRAARERVRAEVVEGIVQSARRQLETVGPAELSLRAVARDLGVVSSAVYRYVSSRDELLTLLIVEAYDDLGAHVEAAVEASKGRSPFDRWVDAAVAVRSWAVEHRHEYALLYGTPVPGYEAPELTTPAGTRVSLALLSIVGDAWEAGQLDAVPGPEVSDGLAADLEGLREAVELRLPDEVLVRALAAWTQLFGLVTFELFSQTRGAVTHHEDLLRSCASVMAAQMGLHEGR